MSVNRKLSVPLFFSVPGIVAALFWMGCKPMVQPQRPDDKWPIPIDELKPPKMKLDELTGSWSSESTDVQWDTAERLARIATQVYVDGEAARAEFRDMGFEFAEEIRVKSTVAWVLYDVDLKITVVSFRGSDDKSDWYHNFDVKKIPHSLGFVHRGFETLYGSIKSRILNSIDQHSSNSLWVTGHSLGGALSLLCAEDLESNHHKTITGLVTFGQPMAFDAKAALALQKLLSGRYQRFINYGDPVPRTPPRYSHCGSWVWFRDPTYERSDPIRVAFSAQANHDATLISDPGPGQLSEAEYQAFKLEALAESLALRDENGNPVVQGNLPFFKDHSTDQYISSIVNQQTAQ